MRHLHYYRVKAKTHFELGYKLARLFKSPSLDTYYAILRLIPYHKTVLNDSHSYLQITSDYFPQYVEELKGYAKGLDVDFASFWLTFLYEELNAYPEKCTSCIAGNGTLVGHNEDFDDHFKKRISILEKTLGDLTVMELFYYNSLGGTACSINSNGYAQTINTLSHYDQRIGVPRNIVARWLSETKDPEKDYEKMKIMMRSLGYSHSFTNRRGETFNIESSANASKLIRPKLPFVHTNHFLTNLSLYEDREDMGNSLDRYNEATKLLPESRNAQDMMKLLENVSSLMSNKDRKIQTIARMVIDIKEKTVWAWLQREKAKGWIRYPLRFL